MRRLSDTGTALGKSLCNPDCSSFVFLAKSKSFIIKYAKPCQFDRCNFSYFFINLSAKSRSYNRND